MADEAKLEEELKIKRKSPTVKKEYLFSKMQKLYDISKTISRDSSKLPAFSLQLSQMESVRTKFETTVFDLFEIESQLKINAKFSPSELESFDEMYDSCRLAVNKYTKSSSVGESEKNEMSVPALPKLSLFEFDGNLENWVTFYDTFVSLVHNRNFSDIDKFHYLLSALKGSALNIAKKLPITATNYNLIWNSLIEKYQDNRILASRYFDKMLNFTPLNKDTLSNLTLFIETYDHSLKAIQALNINNLDDFLICHLALRKLDPHTRKRFEESRDQKSIPTFSELIDFINKQIKVLEHTGSTATYNSPGTSRPNYNNNSNKTNNNYRSASSKSVLAASKNTNSVSCIHCKQNHMIYRCDQFRKLPVDKRIDRVNALNLCTNCLKSDHNNINCKSAITCGVCDSQHHYLLHKDSGCRSDSSVVSKAVPQLPTGQASQAHQALMSSHYVSERDQLISDNSAREYGVVLGTTLIHTVDVVGHYQDCRAVLDSGAQSSFITTECAQKLGLPRKKCPFSISGLGGRSIKNLGMVTCTLKPRHTERPCFTVDLVVVSKVSAEMPNVNFDDKIIEKYNSYRLADPLFYKKSRIDILLGNDILPNLIVDKPLTINNDIPCIFETVFGFVVSGKLYLRKNECSQNLHLSISYEDEQSIDKTLRSFWEIEEVPCTPELNPLDKLAEQIYSNEHRRESNGQYVVPLPFAPDCPPLGDSRAVAERRLLHTERKLARTPDLQRMYNDFMREYIQLEHMELYQGVEPSKYIIPHHSILRPSSTSTPIRVVFDASAKSSNNVSLNDILLVGPKLYPDIVAIILNFRLFEYCLVSDVCKMYRAIGLREQDRSFQHILFRESPNDSIQLYELKTVTYGLSCSPFLAIRTLLQLAEDEGKRFPLAAQVLREAVYMDDILYSCLDYEQACLIQDQLINIFKSANFTLKKWMSNSEELLTRVPAENRESSITFKKEDQDHSVKVLGLKWIPTADNFIFSVNKTDHVFTKRSVLKLLASIYDPVGFISPCTFVAKCIMQDIWKLGIGWDQQLPVEVSAQWSAFLAELPLLSEVQIERHMLLPGKTDCDIVGFCDGSSRGYAACVYVISRDQNNTKVRLVTAKSKVAPIKAVTIPRLELMAACLLSKLMKFVCDTFSRVKINKITALTDSTIVLSWLQTEPYKLKTFVCHRVTQIVDTLPPHYWRHINSEFNLADVGSRGASPAQLVSRSQQWFMGASWMYDKVDDWPISNVLEKNDNNLPELKSSCNFLIENDNKTNYIESKKEFCDRLFNQFSSFNKLQRSIAWLLRFKNKLNIINKSTVLSTIELNNALDVLIKLVQSTYFESEIQLLKDNKHVPSLRKLSPFLDDQGFIRVGGRLDHSELPYNTKHPRLLPKNCLFTKLLIEYLHKKYLHVGPRTLQGIINENYWIPSARSIIRSVLGKCITCFKCKPTLLQPQMASLPSTRLMPNKVFTHVGVDLGGWFMIKESLRRNAKVSKAYVALFICFSTKAVHLEVLSSLSAECFLACLDRFVARRGLCSVLYSDCGTNFIAASKHLSDVQKFLRDNQNDISDGCAQRQVVWKFNVPSAPHMGGLWEAGIKSAKYHLKRSVGEKALTFEELSTVFSRAEAILNSRPLCPLPASDNPNEFSVLTAGHFLIGKSLTAVPEYDLSDININRLSRWQYVQKSSQLFWKRWNREYLNTLQQRAKWFTSSPNLNTGDLVLVKTDNVYPCKWILGKIEKLHTGSDGVVRSVTLRTEKSILQRPVNKLSPLPYSN